MKNNNQFASSYYTVGQVNAIVKKLKEQGGEDGPERFLRGEITVTKFDEHKGSLNEPISTLREMKKNGQLAWPMYLIVTQPEEISPPFLHIPSVEMRYHMHMRSSRGRKERKKIVLVSRELEQQTEVTGRIPGYMEFAPLSHYKYPWPYKIVSRWSVVLAFTILRFFSKTVK